MSWLSDNRDLECFLVTKHSWKGKYKRIFSVGTASITTYNPATLEITNQWPYHDFYNIAPALKPGAVPGEFQITMKHRNKRDTMRFSCDYADELLTRAAKLRRLFGEQNQQRQNMRTNAYKQHWSDSRVPVTLEATEAALNQLDQRGNVIKEYQYKAIVEITKMTDYPGGFCIDYGPQRRRHLFACQSVDELIQEMVRNAYENIGAHIRLNKSTMSLTQFTVTRLGGCGSDEQLTSFVEFTVHKVALRHQAPVKRLLCLSETCIVERDVSSYAAISSRALLQVCCVVRSERDPQLFQIEYENGDIRSYTATERDNILASLLDGVRAAGNVDVHVRATPIERGLRLTPYAVTLDQDAESQLVRQLIAQPPTVRRHDMIRRFNANIPYSGLIYPASQEGLFSENKERLINNCLLSVLCGAEESRQEPQEQQQNERLEAVFQALHRLFASKAGFHAFTATQGVRQRLGEIVVKALKRNSESVNHAAIDMLCALLQPMHSNYELRQEQINKTSLLSSQVFIEHLLKVLTEHVARGTGGLVIASLLDFFTYAICSPYSETTDGALFDNLLELVADKGRSFYKLFQTSSTTIVKGAGLVMRAIIEESTPEISARMQQLALVEGAYLKHLHASLFTDSKDIRMLTNRQLSRHLIALWSSENEAAIELLSRCVPKGLLDALLSSEKVPVKEEELLMVRNNLNIANLEDRKVNMVTQQILDVQRVIEKQLDGLMEHWRLRQKMSFLKKEEKAQVKPVTLRRRRQRVRVEGNWKLFYYRFGKDHAKSDLIWNHKTREELREVLENELRLLNVGKELTSGIQISWNHTEFEVIYPSLADEIKIGNYYLRVLLEEDKNADTPTPIDKPYAFFNEVYHRFLLSAKPEMRCLCLQAMAVTYGRHWPDIGPFADTKYLVAMLDRCMNAMERDFLLELMSKLIYCKDNVRQMINAGLIVNLVEMATLCHLHVSRAVAPNQSNVIEASASQLSEGGTKEWYYSSTTDGRQGPLSLQELKTLYKDGGISDKTNIWAQGLEGWKALNTVPQLRWTLCSTGSATKNETQLAILILDMLIKICEFYPSRDTDGFVVRPVPKVKNLLTQQNCLPHIVQLLLTFDSFIVQRTATLLLHVMQDNPYISGLYLSGVFFFIMMYTGSNVLPIARFLHYSHTKQAFRSQIPKSELIKRSVLGPILPEAAIYYLENHGADKYAQVFLGEFDHPEVIWNDKMRRQMIERLAAHVSDFSPRLLSNVKAVYQFCPIAPIAYAALEDELFCNVYYLRHLCDLVRFPDWPIREPVEFLKSCLQTWMDEIEKKPPSMSIEEACQLLGLTLDNANESESVIRRSYFKLAQKYHPDKNPEGRDMFEKINTAYEFLCSQASRRVLEGPDPQRLELCIQAQSIVYSRHMDDLHPFKYAGYGQLMRTIRLETLDDALFSKSAPLLAAAAELCYHTLACSALNAEQLRRENGLEALEEAMNRCVSVLSDSSTHDLLATRVCLHVCRCFATAAQFDSCREKLSQMRYVFSDLCRILYFRHLTKLSSVASECVGAFAVCTLLQTQLFQAGVLWYLLPNLFDYDFTLDEGGVAKEESSNQQELKNHLARVSCETCAALAGYRDGCPENDGVQNSLRAMLSAYILRCMANETVDFVLKTLNSNTENPYLIWDNGTRAEVTEFVEKERTATTKSSERFGAEFRFSVYEKELIIGDIFVRVYNEQPTFHLTDAKTFCMDLLEYLNEQLQTLTSALNLPTPTSAIANGTVDSVKTTNMRSNSTDGRFKHAAMALEALRNVVKMNPGLEMLCIGHFRLLFNYFRLDGHRDIQLQALEAVSLAAANQECVGDIAACGSLVSLFVLMACLPESINMVLSTLFALCSNGTVVKDALDHGGLTYLLDLLCNNEDPEIRSAAAELIGKMQSDKLTGPRWSRALATYLPPIFSDAARDNPRSCLQLMDTPTENPELIWNDETRRLVKQTVALEKERMLERQRQGDTVSWKPRPGGPVYADSVAGELMVGGVFVRLFIANPAYVLRQPRQFLTELTERSLAEMRARNPNAELIETLSTALVALLQHQPALTDLVAGQGYLPQLCDVMRGSASDGGDVARASIVLFQQLTTSRVCVQAMAKLPSCLLGVVEAMRRRVDLLHRAAKGLKSMFEEDNSELVGQALDCHLIDFLLKLLASSLAETENPQAVKAELVDCLKAMTRNLEHGDKVSQILSQSKVWAQFKDQRHDLFIQNTPQIQALTAGSGMAGYLTQGTNYNQNVVPPSPHMSS